jgi:hypothetical protein
MDHTKFWDLFVFEKRTKLTPMERYQLAEYISDTLTHNCGNINKSESQS